MRPRSSASRSRTTTGRRSGSTQSTVHAAQGRAAVQPSAADQHLTQPQAVARLAGPAVAALAARRPADDDRITLAEVGDPGPSRSDRPAPSWPSTPGSGNGRSPCRTSPSVWQIPVARVDPHQHLARARLVEVKLCQDERTVEFFDDRRSDAH